MSYLLPTEAYHDPAWLARERTALLTHRWTLVASEDELARPGAAVAATLGEAPVVVARGEDGDLHAHHNLCRHRGMQLLDDGCHQVDGALTCFYHQWRFGLDESLVRVPQRRSQFPDLDPTAWGLRPASVATWEGLVFVHPDPGAPPLGDELGGLVDHLGSFRPGLLAQVGRIDLEARCNWKLFVENHIDVYHLWYLHAATLGDFDHTRFEHTSQDGDWFSYEPRRAGAADVLGDGATPIAHLDERDRAGLGAHLVFPTLLLATASTFFATYQAVPLAVDRTRIELRIRAEPSADADALVAATRSFIEEDIAACERVQAGVTSPAFEVGPLARDHEAPIEAFHRHLLARLGAGDDGT